MTARLFFVALLTLAAAPRAQAYGCETLLCCVDQLENMQTWLDTHNQKQLDEANEYFWNWRDVCFDIEDIILEMDPDDAEYAEWAFFQCYEPAESWFHGQLRSIESYRVSMVESNQDDFKSCVEGL